MNKSQRLPQHPNSTTRQQLTVAVSFARDSSHYPNIKAADRAERHAIYWRCICVALASAKYLGGEFVVPLVISNEEIPDDYKAFFDRHGIGFQKIAFSHRPPDGFSESFIGSLFTLDVIAWFGTQADENDKLLLIDPDCFVTSALENVNAYLDHVQALVYVVAYPRGQVNNGQSLDGMTEWMRRCVPDMERWDLRWLGGEFFGLTGAACRMLTPVIARIWQTNLTAFAAGEPYLKTEEHVLSVAFAGTRPTRRDAGGLCSSPVDDARLSQSEPCRAGTARVAHAGGETAWFRPSLPTPVRLSRR